jgi:hypothetical protein
MLNELDAEVADAVEYYYSTLSDQAEAQRRSEQTARGRRAEVLGGQQMDGFASLVEDLVHEETGSPTSRSGTTTTPPCRGTTATRRSGTPQWFTRANSSP